MFRRIELIHELGADEYNTVIRATAHQSGIEEDEVRATFARFQKTGIVGSGNEVIWDAWNHMPNPSREINKHCRFFFTEEGW
ncbi:MAG: hypothetical protein M3R24_27605 [Chloroflexota bacterium]|nr:hypothetical protein [Chloroflexota bacterium]